MDETVSAGLGGLVGAAGSIAMGNPIGAAFAIGGAGLSIFGAMNKVDASKEMAGIQTKQTQLEMQQDRVRREAMRLSARRQQMEVLRNAQRARSLALNNSTAQGAQFGSGLQGGYGQIQGAADWNIAGINQNLNFGEQMFDLNAAISQQKIQMSQAQSKAANAGAYSSLGGTLLQNAPTAGKFGKQAASMFSNNGSIPSLGGYTGNDIAFGLT